MTRHVVIGGCGFVGSALIRQLAERGAEIVNFDIRSPTGPTAPSSVRFVAGDVTNRGDLERLELGPDDVVYHLAARQFADAVPRRNRQAWFAAVNVEGTRNVVEAMRARGAHRLVFFSTDMTYGVPQSSPVKPDHPQSPLGPYGITKKEAESIILSAKTVNSTIFRPRLITGPGRLGILGKLFKLIRAGLPVPMIGSGANRYQMVGVEDCARAAILAVDASCPPGPFNLGSAHPPTARELLQGIIHHAKSRSILLPVSSRLMKPILSTLDDIGLTLLYPEQFQIADLDILLDTSETARVLGWRAQLGDIDMMNAAYDAFVAA